ncbi:MAG: hypothetical protein J1E84_04595 [Muribaculaceae bacterium]|nr:hypothetical protein [Muribaculaceae bacterium]
MAYIERILKRVFFVYIAWVIALVASAADPTATKYSYRECGGSLRPYPAPEKYNYPDTLTPVFIYHVGRHGSRYPAGSGTTLGLIKVLRQADSLKTITPLGKQLLATANEVVARVNGQWGALDSLGMAEQRAIASRMYDRFKSLMSNARIEALSSYSPRCIMSMYSFTHQLSRLNNQMEITTSSGRQHSPLMRPFDVESDYNEYIQSGAWNELYREFMEKTVPLTALRRVVGDKFPMDEIDARAAAMNEYYVIAGMGAMMMDVDESRYFSLAEYNALWSVFNLRQYLQRTSTTISTVPSEIASPLLLDLITSIQGVVDGKSMGIVKLRFGHGETLMPLLSLMHLDDCYYITNYFDTVAMHWRDFDVVPMSANLQIVLFRSAKGHYYVQALLNEAPVKLIKNVDKTIVSWEQARTYLNRCVPLYYQIAL